MSPHPTILEVPDVTFLSRGTQVPCGVLPFRPLRPRYSARSTIWTSFFLSYHGVLALGIHCHPSRSWLLGSRLLCSRERDLQTPRTHENLPIFISRINQISHSELEQPSFALSNRVVFEAQQCRVILLVEASFDCPIPVGRHICL